MNPLTRLSHKLRPDLAPMEGLEKAGNLLNMYNVLLGLVPALGALAWLIVATDAGTLRSAVAAAAAAGDADGAFWPAQLSPAPGSASRRFC